MRILFKGLFSIWQSKLILTVDEISREQRKKDIDDRLTACRKRIESVCLLFENQNYEDSFIILEYLAMDMINTGLVICGQSPLASQVARKTDLSFINDNSILKVLLAVIEILNQPSDVFKKYDNLYDTLYAGQEGLEKAFKRLKKCSLMTSKDIYQRKRLVCLTTVALLSIAAISWSLHYYYVQLPALRADEITKAKSSQIRLADLDAIKQALVKNHDKYGTYPQGFGPESNFDQQGELRPDWIPGLAPEFIAQLPRDPRNSTSKHEQYFYYSDGKDFKIISHAAEDCKFVKKSHPEMIDPVRDCWAYGYWTPNASKW
ncbi:MAG: hypothetical protein HQK81_11630 [Desulfovibrionaceae bacterium]|nr:hypothetical protein [Desulfovibrionaceae bacterium]MBF0514693.1 hypothetical protein [Desulfovibrionaceae bacterium]